MTRAELADMGIRFLQFGGDCGTSAAMAGSTRTPSTAAAAGPFATGGRRDT